LSGPLASVLLVTWNGLEEATRPCLDSLFAVPAGLPFEAVVVDNGSTDGTREYLAALAAREPRLKVRFNGTNRGFAGGNNDAIAEAKGDLLVLLNNDTELSGGWLGRLCAPLLRDPSVGLAGPVSNSVGNEQMILAQGATPAAILEAGAAWTRAAEGDTFETGRLGFFCVAARREVVARTGLLDEGYGLGFFEDDDYCIRVRQAGYRLLCVEDVFVYHRGSVSFGKVPDTVRALLKANRKRLEDKFRIRHAPPHPRDRQLELAEACLDRMAAGEGDLSGYKARVRLDTARSLRPRGWFKRLRFDARHAKATARLEALCGKA
jgi:GT2 family glycosyltransferase